MVTASSLTPVPPPSTRRGRIRFSWKVTTTCAVLIALMVRASFWQWDRHLQKETYVALLNQRLSAAPVPLQEILQLPRSEFLHRRVLVTGSYDFSKEMVLRNRKHEEEAGGHVLTPLKLAGSEDTILVDRGFIPLMELGPEQRAQFQRPAEASFIGLIKEPSSPSFFAPKDPVSGGANPWVDAWLRVDLAAMQRQIPYRLYDFYVELIGNASPAEAEQQIVRSSSGREELLLMGLQQVQNHATPRRALADYPVPAFDTVIPPARHLGYVYEWAGMAVMTLFIGIVLQLRGNRK